MNGQFHATAALTTRKEPSVLEVGSRAGLSALEINFFFKPGIELGVYFSPWPINYTD
jgi:hypothetical protein